MPGTFDRILLILALCLLPAGPSRAEFFEFDRHPIDLDFPGVSCVRILDMDGDGDLDIIAGSETTPSSSSIGVAYLRNDGGLPPTWTRFAIDPTFDNVMSVDVGFVDGDTFPDLVASSWNLHQVAWWQNSGDPTQPWAKRVIMAGYVNAHDAECADLDRDGDTDIVATNSTPGSVVICTSNGASPPGFTPSTLASGFRGGKSVLIADLNRDQAPDILAAAADGDELTWWQNQGGMPVTWQRWPIATDFDGSHDMDAVDLDRDGQLDVVATAWVSNQVAYWISDDIAANLWTRTSVSTSLAIAVRALGGDMDNDLDTDIVAMGKIPGELAIYENVGATWPKTTLESGFTGGWALEVVDMDDDGDLDIVGGASALGELYWWENRVVTVSVAPGRVPPPKLLLERNRPNPFGAGTIISYLLPRAGHVRLSVHDLSGRVVAVLTDAEQAAGAHEVEWRAACLPTGAYFFLLTTGSEQASRRVLHLE